MSSAMITTKLGRAAAAGVEPAGERPHPGPPTMRPTTTTATGSQPRRTPGSLYGSGSHFLTPRRELGGPLAAMYEANAGTRAKEGACLQGDGAAG